MQFSSRALVVTTRLIVGICATVCLSAACQPSPSYDQLIRTAVPLYDQQNQEIYSSLLLPLQTHETNRLSSGVINGAAYGRLLSVYYDTTLSIDELISAYSTNLGKLDWRLYRQDSYLPNSALEFENLYFYKQTACIEFNMEFSLQKPPGATGSYEILIWHDFFRQPFSIPTPSKTNLCWDGGCFPCP